MARKKLRSVSDTIRQAIEAAASSRYAISQATGIPQSALSRFMSGERGLSMEYIDVLADYFQLELRPRTGRRS